MRRMGLDVGEKTIGIAVSDPTGLVATPREVIRRQGWKQDAQRLADLAVKYEIEELVVGLPVRTDGSRGEEAERVKRFGRRIGDRLGLPVVYWDERFSTRSATQALIAADVSREKRKQVVDAVAAAVILQNYLDWRQRSG